MGNKTKQGKGRQDKFYHLAKDQGWRARSAFKLVQLAKKYDFLSRARVCLDLCGAPGGWSQVCAQYMPVGAQILCVDIMPIKPIRGVTCIQADITTSQCRSLLRTEMSGKAADVVLNDGAPNVGSHWSKDAYNQAELTLHATKLACEFLRPGGTYVTKVFRSADYNSLLWVFQQMFHRVEATKPQASRNVSAEIFVTCTGYKAPSKIDNKFFDPKHVFLETIAEQDAARGGRKQSLAEVWKHRAKKRRGGYEDGDDFRVITAQEFMDAQNAATLLLSAHKISFPSPECDQYTSHKTTTEEILEICNDLKVCGKNDLQRVMRWRVNIVREKTDAAKAEKKKEIDELRAANAVGKGADQADELLDRELTEAVAAQLRKEKRARKKQLKKEKKAEWRRKMSFGTYDATQVDPDLLMANKRNSKLLEESSILESKDEQAMSESSGSEVELSESEDSQEYAARLDLEMAMRYEAEREEKELRHDGREAGKKKRKKEQRRAIKTREWTEEMKEFSEKIDNQAYEDHMQKQHHSSSDEDGDESDVDSEELEKVLQSRGTTLEGEELEKAKAKMRSMRWFSQDVFKSFKAPDPDSDAEPELAQKSDSGSESEDGAQINELDDSELPQLPLTEKDKRKLRRAKERRRADAKAARDKGDLSDDDKEFETVPAEAPAEFDDPVPVVVNPALEKPTDPKELAETLAIGSLLITKKSRMEVIDAAYNKWVFHDKDLPEWFKEEEELYCKPELPVTKELVQQYRDKMREINARPIRKVSEAQSRKKKRMHKKLETLRKQAAALADSELTAQAKVKGVRKLMSKAARKDERVTVAATSRKGGGTVVSGKQPRNAKVVIVDRRLKSDKRGQGAADRKNKKKGRNIGTKKKQPTKSKQAKARSAQKKRGK